MIGTAMIAMPGSARYAGQDRHHDIAKQQLPEGETEPGKDVADARRVAGEMFFRRK